MDIYRCFPLDYDFELARFRCAKNKASSKRLSTDKMYYSVMQQVRVGDFKTKQQIGNKENKNCCSCF